MKTAKKLACLLAGRGHNCRFHPDADGRADMMIVIGGDGTVLRAVRDCAGGGVPIWAVNAGHVGYLPAAIAFEYTSYETDITRFVQGTGEMVRDEYIRMLNELYGA